MRLAPLREFRVTVALPVYNGAATLRRALDSLVKQDYPHLTIDIADDASTDESAAICREYSAYPQVRFEQNPRNLGSWGNFIKLLERAEGELFLWGCQDDWWHPSFISALVDRFRRNPRTVSAVCAMQLVTTSGAPHRLLHLVPKNQPMRQSHTQLLRTIINKQNDSPETVKNNIFIHGVVRHDVFLDSIRAYPGIFLGERQIVCQWALIGDLEYVDQTLCEKLHTGKSLEERRPTTDPYMLNLRQPARCIRYLFGLVVGILRSGFIPPQRKLYIFPVIGIYARSRLYGWAVRRMRQALPSSAYEAMRRRWGRTARKAP